MLNHNPNTDVEESECFNSLFSAIKIFKAKEEPFIVIHHNIPFHWGLLYL